MKIQTRCNHCGKMYNMAANFAGKTAQCKQCKNTFLMAPIPQAAHTPQPGQAPPLQAPGSFVDAAPFVNQTPPPQMPEHQSLSPQASPQTHLGGAAPNPYNSPQPPSNFVPQTPQALSSATFPENQAFSAAQAQGAPAYEATDPNQQTVVCPKCKFSAGIPPVAAKMKLRCQECGKIFLIKPDPKFKELIKNAKKSMGALGGGKKPSPKMILIIAGLGLLLLIAGGAALGILPF